MNKSNVKAQICEYKKWSIVVKVEVESQCKALYGMFIPTPKADKAVQVPCWVFSKKRKVKVEKLAAKIGGEVSEYTPGKSIALVAPRPYAEKLEEAGGHFNQKLKDGETEFAGWSFNVKKLDEVTALCATL